MDTTTALKIIDEACASYRGTRADHTQLLAALAVLRDAVTSKAAPKDEPAQTAEIAELKD